MSGRVAITKTNIELNLTDNWLTNYKCDNRASAVTDNWCLITEPEQWLITEPEQWLTIGSIKQFSGAEKLTRH